VSRFIFLFHLEHTVHYLHDYLYVGQIATKVFREEFDVVQFLYITLRVQANVAIGTGWILLSRSRTWFGNVDVQPRLSRNRSH
jgi:hypothetical protein